MFGGAGFYRNGSFFGILHKEHLYFRVSAGTIGDYTSRKAKAFNPVKGRKRTKTPGYYEVPVEVLESPRDLVSWARKAVQAAEET